jgi:hypothetical protein
MKITDLFASVRAKKRAAKGKKNEEREWVLRGYASPSPAHIKRAVLLRLGLPDAVWIETGSFMGDTTEILAKNAGRVYTIEPDKALYENVSRRFQGNQSIHVIHGLSENIFPNLLPTISGSVNFWLDGHYSGGVTHQGPIDCPVRDELLNIENNIGNFTNITILIDDVRCFDPLQAEYRDYPDVDYLVNWCRRNNFSWHIEHDIFVARSR